MNSFVRRLMDSDVLVVDDSAAIRKMLTRVLRQTGMAIQTIREAADGQEALALDRKSTRLNSSHRCISYAVFCLKKKKTNEQRPNAHPSRETSPVSQPHSDEA